MCYQVCGMVHIKDLLLLIKKSSPYSGVIRFLLSISKRSFTVFGASLNITFPFFHRSYVQVTATIYRFEFNNPILEVAVFIRTLQFIFCD